MSDDPYAEAMLANLRAPVQPEAEEDESDPEVQREDAFRDLLALSNQVEAAKNPPPTTLEQLSLTPAPSDSVGTPADQIEKAAAGSYPLTPWGAALAALRAQRGPGR